MNGSIRPFVHPSVVDHDQTATSRFRRAYNCRQMTVRHDCSISEKFGIIATTKDQNCEAKHAMFVVMRFVRGPVSASLSIRSFSCHTTMTTIPPYTRRKRPRSMTTVAAVAALVVPVTANRPYYFPQAVLPPRRVPLLYNTDRGLEFARTLSQAQPVDLPYPQVYVGWDEDEKEGRDGPPRSTEEDSFNPRKQDWWNHWWRRATASTSHNTSTYEIANQPTANVSSTTEDDDEDTGEDPYLYPYTNYTTIHNSSSSSYNQSDGIIYQPPAPDADNGNHATTVYPHFARMRIRALLMEPSYETHIANEPPANTGPSEDATTPPPSSSSSPRLTDDQRQMLLQDMIQPTIDVWGQALRVRPVVGNLVLEAAQLREGHQCGPGPAVVVPEAHFTTGIPETDFVVYIQVGRRVTLHGNATTTLEEEMFHTDEVDEERNVTQRTTNDNESWWNNQDEYLSGNFTSSSHLCQGDYIAASAFCNTDQWDRPVAALLHLCLDDDFFQPQRLHRNIRTIMHELGHSLGFNAVSLAHFRRWDDGEPLTPRDANGAVPLQRVQCTGPQAEEPAWLSNGSSGSTSTTPLPTTVDSEEGYYDVIPLPSPDILQFRTVRGGVRVAQIVTPSVLQVVRNHFDCQTLEGAELESGEYICLGDHWERRLFKTDLMNPIIDTDADFMPRISTLTLAYFADSGWYQVDLPKASFASSWGRGAGCAFVEEPCVDQDGQVPPGLESVFCSTRNTEYHSLNGCTHDLLRKASCLIDQYSEQLPAVYQYFNHTYGSNVGGPDPFVDYCPYYAGFNNGLCSDENNEEFIKIIPMERVGSRNSRCLAGRTPFGDTALCLRIACVVEDKSLRVQVDKTWFTCTHEGQQIQTRLGFKVTCPDPVRTCPTFYCPYDCLGSPQLMCDYGQGECVCPDGELSPPLPDGSCPSMGDEGDGSGTEGTTPNPGSGDGGNGNPFFRPPAGGSVIPPDNPLQDIYFPDERSLIEQVQLEEPSNSGFAWHWPVLGAVGLVAGTLSVALWVRRRRKAQRARLPLTTLDFPGNDDDDDNNNDRPDTDRPAPRPPPTSWRSGDKRKMMATVAVDLRLQDQLSAVWVQQRQQDQDAQTDVASLTDTEGDQSLGSPARRRRPPPPMAEEYLRPTIVEIPALTPPEMACPPPVPRSTVRRRRRLRRLREEASYH